MHLYFYTICRLDVAGNYIYIPNTCISSVSNNITTVVSPELKFSNPTLTDCLVTGRHSHDLLFHNPCSSHLINKSMQFYQFCAIFGGFLCCFMTFTLNPLIWLVSSPRTVIYRKHIFFIFSNICYFLLASHFYHNVIVFHAFSHFRYSLRNHPHSFLFCGTVHCPHV